MTAQQRMAWFQLVVVGGTLVLWLATLPFLGRGATGCFGLLGLLGFAPIFHRPRGGAGEPVWDEREGLIHAQSIKAGYFVVWFYFTAACMIPWGWSFLRGATTISIDYLPIMLLVGVIVLVAIQSVAVLLQYRGETDGHD
jgi:hypothetical protein